MSRIFLRCLLWKVLTVFSSFLVSLQFAVVEEYTCNICVDSSDCDCVADFSAVKNFIHRFERIYCKHFFCGWCPFPYLADSPVPCISSTSGYLVGLFNLKNKRKPIKPEAIMESIKSIYW